MNLVVIYNCLSKSFKLHTKPIIFLVAVVENLLNIDIGHICTKQRIQKGEPVLFLTTE